MNPEEYKPVSKSKKRYSSVELRQDAAKESGMDLRKSVNISIPELKTTKNALS